MYAANRLRDRALKSRTDRHADLWQALQVTITGLQRGAVPLGLPALGGLFDESRCAQLDAAELPNTALLQAIRALCFFKSGTVLARINYRDMDTEELGSVYESLLELQPVIQVEANPWHFGFVGDDATGDTRGSARKLTGSYYTPDSLVQELIQSALEPKIAEALRLAERVARSEWRGVREIMAQQPEVRGYVDSVLSRSGSLAAGHDDGGVGLRADPGLSAGGALRADLANPSGGDLHSGEHRRGLGAGEYGGVHSLPAHRQGQSAGTGNPSAAESAGRPLFGTGGGAHADAGRHAEPATAQSAARPATEAELSARWDAIPLATRYSLLARHALLALKIIDPACGSGHFLLAAARRIAAEIARLDAESDIPEAVAYRHALREVVAHCIYGVDLNPLAVELCQTALWLETLEPGKPLGFLDHHIRHGNSLVGILDPGIMDEGIPDKAYIALSGDDKPTCSALKKSNKKQMGGRQDDMYGATTEDTLGRSLADLDALPEDSVEAIAAKRAAFQQAEADEGLARQRLKADLFCAAFFAPKTPATAERIPLSSDLQRAATGQSLRPGVAELARELAGEYHFFHWRLAFPEVFAQGGFDVVLANPPWERIKLQEQEFFAARSPEIAGAPNAAARTRLIQALQSEDASPVDQRLYRDFIMAKRGAEGASLFAHDSGRFPLTGVGDVNLYALFAESIAQLIGERGRGGFIVPTGIATDDSTKLYFEAISQKRRLAALYSFENEEFIFRSVHHAMKFCLMIIGGTEADIRQAAFVHFARQTSYLHDQDRRFTLTSEEFRLINPNTLTCPVFRSKADAELTKKIYQRVPVLIDERKGAEGNPWGISFMRMLDMSNDSGLFRIAAQMLDAGAEREGPNWRGTDGTLWVPLYEAKMVHQFDHRWATYEDNGTDSRDITEAEKRDPNSTTQPRYWVSAISVDDAIRERWDRPWLMGFRGITNATNERLVISTVIPKLGVGNSMPLLILANHSDRRLYAALAANICSLVFDFVARQKVGGTNLNFFIFQQFSALPPYHYADSDLNFIVTRVLELTYTAHDLRPWFEDVWNSLGDTPEGEATRDRIRAAWAESHGQPVTPGPSPLAPFPFSPDRRARLRAELDAYYARLYGLTRDELRYILDPADVHGPDYPSETFRVLKNNEIRQFGEYRTQRLVLEAWDGLEKRLD